jgi:hypothetical protein
MLDMKTCEACINNTKVLGWYWKKEFEMGFIRGCPKANHWFSIYLTPRKCPHKDKHIKTEEVFLDIDICQKCVYDNGKTNVDKAT